MTDLSFLDAAILGAVQGLTELLPISSSAHLAFVQRWMGFDADSPPMLLFDGLSHIATLGSIVAVFAGPIRRFAEKFLRDLRPSYRGPRHAMRIAILGIAASVPTA